jgi:hypothetical protein
MIYGYARVSTDGESVDAQVKQLRAAGAANVYRETASGAKTERASCNLSSTSSTQATFSRSRCSTGLRDRPVTS